MTIKDVKRELIVWAAVLLSAAYSAVVAAKPMDFEESKKIFDFVLTVSQGGI